MADMACEWCGAPLPEGARFCPRCGSPVPAALPEDGTEPAVGGPLDVTERKVVTVLFADLARSTELAARLDPERLREVMNAFYAMVSRELSSLRGRAEKFAGDAAMAVFGLPHAHEDDALRAVRAGITIRDRTARLGETLGLPVPLRVRVGINSGSVAAGLLGEGAGPDRPLVSGAPVNLAARLQQAAEPGEILAGETTWQLTRHAVEYGEPREVQARGFAEAVQAWPVRTLSARSTRRTIPLVGRRRELGLLTDTFDRVRETSRAHLFTLLGEPGIGKSRLADELVAALPEGTRILSGRASELGEDPTFAPIAEMIRHELGVDAAAPADELRVRLKEVVEGCCEPTESEQVAARLGLALGLGEPGREDQRYRAAEIRAGFTAFLEGLARQGPAVLVFEDLQHARPGLLDLIDGVLGGVRKRPVLVLGVSRDWLIEQRPEWGRGHPDTVTLRLEPLETVEAAELAQAAGEEVDDATALRIAAHSGGNPFFIVETTGMLLERHAEDIEGTPHSHLLPPTVQAVVASRIDHLPEEARDLIRKASVFAASTFSVSELALIADPREDVLGALQDAELLVADPERPNVWRFRHEVLREVAYESLPKRERERLHVQVAAGLLALGGPDRYPQSVAHHLEQAARAALDLDPSDRTLADRAFEALAHAGDVSRWRIESRAAVDLYERALTMAGPEDTWGQREARVLSSTGEAQYWLGDFDRSAASLERALTVASEDPWTQAHACRFLGDIELNLRGRPEEAETLFQRALAAARVLGDPFAEARTLLMGAWAPFWRDDLAAARDMFERALAIARANPGGDRWAEARALVSLTSVVSPTGDEEEALALAEEALALGQKMRDPFTTAVARQDVANSFRRMHRLDESMEQFDRAVSTFRELGAKWELASALDDRATVQRLAGRLDAAEADTRESLRLCRELGDRMMTAWAVSDLVRVLVDRGDTDGARRAFQETLAAVGVADNPESRLAVVKAEALIALAEGNRERALERTLAQLEIELPRGQPNPSAALTWWTGRLFGPDAVGGEEALDAARERLEKAGWRQALLEPDLFAKAVTAGR